METKVVANEDIEAKSVLDLIGKTPLVKLRRLVPAGSGSIYAKLEFLNPGGSVKDRICLAMVVDAEARGLLSKDSTIIEPTSGNTGIGLALVCVAKGYRCILVMPETMSLERGYILRSYGAQVVLTQGKDGMQGAIKKAEEISAKTPGSLILHQFENRANVETHRQTTAYEILKDLGTEIDAFVAGVGTGGTITGVGEVLKEHNPGIRIIAVEPKGSAVLSGGKPGSHKIQGIGAGFVPKILNREIIDDVIAVSDEDAFETSRKLAQQEALLVGLSSGAAAWAALKVARDLGEGSRIVTVFPDRGDRYFTTEQYFEA